MKISKVLTACGIAIFLLSCGNDLRPKKIGQQIWATKNLNITKFKNGDKIKKVMSLEEMISANDQKIPAYTYYDFDSKNGKKYGFLYNKYVVYNSDKLTPSGWHMPTIDEWRLLMNEYYEGNVQFIKNNMEWGESDPEKIIESNFDALPGGIYNLDYNFTSLGCMTIWWVKPSNEFGSAEGIELEKNSISRTRNPRDLSYFYIRLIKDEK